MSKLPRFSRRQVVGQIVGVGGVGLLAACSSASPAAPTGAASSQSSTSSGSAPTSQASAPTSQASAPSTSASAPATQPTTAPQSAASSGSAASVPRNQTLVCECIDQPLNQFADVKLMNPFQTGITRSGYNFVMEPLYYYNPYYTDTVCGPSGVTCKDGEIPWLAESYAYNSDYTQVTVKIRPNVTWSDGQPFTANDVAFTIDMLKDNAPKLTWSTDMKQWVKEATAQDDHTALITLNNPNPRFFFSYFTFHEDIGIQIVPEHIWKGQDPTTFTNFDMSKGWPIVTGPWKLTLSNAQQKIWDRRDDWWAAKTGFHPLPNMKRVTYVPNAVDTKTVEMAVANQIDSAATVQTVPDFKTMFARNPKVTTWSGQNPPYGYMDWWPWGIGFNDSQAPYNDPDIRWAINYALDRDQMVSIAYQGAGDKTDLPFPRFPSLVKFLDTIQDLLQKYPVGTYDPKKTEQIMQSKGYTKNQQNMWEKGGKTFSMVIQITNNFLSLAPVVVAQLRKAGFDASFKQSSNLGTLMSTGELDAYLSGHGGSVRDPYFTLRLYQSQFSAPTGQPATYPYRWVNKDYDKIVDQMGETAPDDPKLVTLFHDAMEIWLQNLPDITLLLNYHRIPTVTTYWTNWPDAKNPYINSANWHRTAPLWINTLKPAQ